MKNLDGGNKVHTTNAIQKFKGYYLRYEAFGMKDNRGKLPCVYNFMFRQLMTKAAQNATSRRWLKVVPKDLSHQTANLLLVRKEPTDVRVKRFSLLLVTKKPHGVSVQGLSIPERIVLLIGSWKCLSPSKSSSFCGQLSTLTWLLMICH